MDIDFTRWESELLADVEARQAVKDFEAFGDAEEVGEVVRLFGNEDELRQTWTGCVSCGVLFDTAEWDDIMCPGCSAS